MQRDWRWRKTAGIGACPFKMVITLVLQISQAMLKLFPRKRLTVQVLWFLKPWIYSHPPPGTPYSLPGRSSLTKSHNGRLPPGLLKLKNVRCFPWSSDFSGDPSVPTSTPLPTTQDIFLGQGVSPKAPGSPPQLCFSGSYSFQRSSAQGFEEKPLFPFKGSGMLIFKYTVLSFSNALSLQGPIIVLLLPLIPKG